MAENEEIKNLKKKLLRKYPTFGSTINNVEFKAVGQLSGIDTAATNGNTIYFNKNFMRGLDEEQRLFMLAHEVGHIALRHYERSKDKDQKVFNIAADAVLNQFLLKDGLKKVDGIIDIPEAINYSVDELYDKLLKEKQQQMQNERQEEQNQKNTKSQNDAQNKQENTQGQQDRQENQQNTQSNRQNQQDNAQRQQNDTQNEQENAQNSQKDNQNELDNNQSKQDNAQRQQNDGQEEQKQNNAQSQDDRQNQQKNTQGEQDRQENQQNTQSNRQNQQDNAQRQQNNTKNEQDNAQSKQDNAQSKQDNAQNGQNSTKNEQENSQGQQDNSQNGQNRQNNQNNLDDAQGDPNAPQNGQDNAQGSNSQSNGKQADNLSSKYGIDWANNTNEQKVGHDDHSMWKEAQNELEQGQNESNQNQKSQEQRESDNIGEESIDERNFFKENEKEKVRRAEEIMSKINSQRRGIGGTAKLGGFEDVGTADKPVVNWKKILKEELEKEDEAWGYRFSDRGNGYRARLQDVEYEEQPDTEIILDVSGSISYELLLNFLRQMKLLLKNSDIKVGTFSYDFNGWHPIKKDKDIDDFARYMRIGGGTNFDAASRAFSKDPHVNKIVFTDGQDGGNAGIQEPRKDIIWITFENKYFKPDKGKVIYVPPEAIMGNQRLLKDDKQM